MRIIALSATLPNLVDIGEWLGCRPECIHYFDESFRPVPLSVHTVAMGSAGANPYLFERSLDERVPELVARFGAGKQVLIFCSSKKGTENLSTSLARKISNTPMFAQQRQRMQQQQQQGGGVNVASIGDTELRNLAGQGFAFHHAGLSPDDRAAVEDLFLAGRVRILCSTSTLAHGVNLPAHLVIIKGTNCWRGGSRGYERTSKSDIIQMLGRAGRPGYDDNGVAVIMTSNEDKQHYSDVALHADVVESTLQGHIVEGEDQAHRSRTHPTT